MFKFLAPFWLGCSFAFFLSGDSFNAAICLGSSALVYGVIAIARFGKSA